LLDKFVRMCTRRAFKAFLALDKEARKVNLEFVPRYTKFPPRKTAATARTGAASARGTGTTAKKTSKPATKKTAAAKTPRKASTAAGKTPSAQLAAVIGADPVARPEAVKKMWDYIKAHNLQDPQDKRTIVADDKLRAVFGKDRIGMFELAGVLGGHLG
ncbi:MAG: DNA topoisomerase III, partial [Proteobacteria bacterium]|nr:DNA topoisomerase III [Pseudomonadota bacterium]